MFDLARTCLDILWKSFFWFTGFLTEFLQELIKILRCWVGCKVREWQKIISKIRYFKNQPSVLNGMTYFANTSYLNFP